MRKCSKVRGHFTHILHFRRDICELLMCDRRSWWVSEFWFNVCVTLHFKHVSLETSKSLNKEFFFFFFARMSRSHWTTLSYMNIPVNLIGSGMHCRRDSAVSPVITFASAWLSCSVWCVRPKAHYPEGNKSYFVCTVAEH